MKIGNKFLIVLSIGAIGFVTQNIEVLCLKLFPHNQKYGILFGAFCGSISAYFIAKKLPKKQRSSFFDPLQLQRAKEIIQ